MPPISWIDDDLEASLPQLGKLYKGAPKDPKKPGKDLDYFRFEGKSEAITAAFHKAYGKTPRQLAVNLAFETVGKCFPDWCEEYTAGGLVHQCDGKNMVWWRTPKGTYSNESKPCPYESGTTPRTNTNPGCKPIGRLKVFLPKLVHEGHVGFVVLETHSIHDIRAIGKVLRFLERECRGPEGMYQFPCTILRQEEEISTPGPDGKRVRRKKWLVVLHPEPVWLRRQIEAATQLPELPEPCSLEAPAAPPASPTAARTPETPTATPAPAPKAPEPARKAAQAPAKEVPTEPLAESKSVQRRKVAQKAVEPPKVVTPEVVEPIQPTQRCGGVVPPEPPVRRPLTTKAKVFGQEMLTAGITGETMNELIKVCKTYDKAINDGEASKNLLLELHNMTSRVYLTEQEGQEFIGFIRETLVQISEPPQ